MALPEADAPRRGDGADLQRRRHEIGRGLTRSHYAVVAASGLIGLIALAALWMGAEARRRADDARDAATRLWEFSSRAARQERLSRATGQRNESLAIIREAARLRPSRQLRDEALSALLLPDMGSNLVWHEEKEFAIAAAYDATFEHFILNNDAGRSPPSARAIVRRTSDGTTLMEAEGFGVATPFWQFSPDGRLAAIAFRRGPIGVWDWRRTNLVATFPTITQADDWLKPPFDFSPDGRSLWVLDPSRKLVRYDFPSSTPAFSLSPEHVALSVRLSPSGKMAALACDNILEVWDLNLSTLRATLTLTNPIWQVAWQPGEERLAVGCEHGLHLWEIGAPQAVTLQPEATVTVLFFTADGDQLFSAGWNFPPTAWNTRDRNVALQFSKVAPWQLSVDQTRLSVSEGRVGYGVQQYLPPVGVRSWPGPVGLGAELWAADVDPRERWMVQARQYGWYLRAADSGRELARIPFKGIRAVKFSADGTNVLTWSANGLRRWPLVETRTGQLSVGEPQTLWSAPDSTVDLAVFADDRRHTSCSQAGRVTVVDLQDLGNPAQFRLEVAADNGHYLSPDGRWLITGHHNQHGLDWYDCQHGKWLRRIANEGFAGPAFDPVRGRLFTSTAAEYSEWDLADGKLLRSAPWRTPAPYQGFQAFAPDGRVALVRSSPSTFQLYDLEAKRDFATLDFRDEQKVFPVYWSHDGQRLFLFGNDGGVTRVDLAALRTELDRLGLNWSDDDPSREFPAAINPASAAVADATPPSRAGSPPSAWRNPPHLIWWVAAGLAATVGIGHYILRYQRKLFAGFLETETLAEQRAEQLRETHAALAHSEKMKALGTMATGVAHDFNNLLSVIRLSSELIEEKTPAEDTMQENFDAIAQAVQRGRGIVNSMLGYARDDGQLRAFAPGALVSDAVALLSKPFLGGLVLEIEVDPATPEVIGRRGRLEQMLLNLVVNAAEAMAGRGTLRLSARPVSEAPGCVLPPRRAAKYVELSIADSGPGITPEVLPRIFEPFFTTKNKGSQRGTGLGLSMLYTMAKEDGVGIAVNSALGKGTTFRLLLPTGSSARNVEPGGLPDSRSAADDAVNAASINRPGGSPAPGSAGRESPVAAPRAAEHRQS